MEGSSFDMSRRLEFEDGGSTMSRVDDATDATDAAEAVESVR